MSVPTIFSWPLIIPSLPAPGAHASGSYLAPGAGTAGPSIRYLTEEDLLDILDRVFPEWYVEPLKAGLGPGYELWQAMAKALEQVSIAVGKAEAVLSVIFSHGGAKATASIEFYRDNDSAGAFLVKAGTIVRTSRTNRSYALLEDVTFGASDLVVAGLVQALAPGGEYNVPGPVSTADGTILAGEIDRIIIPILDPTFAEPTLQVRQIADATGGQAAVLDQQGLDRNLPRFGNESDESYKGRIRSLPDTVTPDAIRRHLDAIFLPMGLEYYLVETWRSEYQTCYDTPGTIDHDLMGFAEDGLFCYDHPSDEPFSGRWLDERDHIAGYVLVVPNLTSWHMRGMAYDDEAELPAEHATSLGRRAHSTYDGLDVDTEAVLVGFYDGDDTFKNLFYMRLWDLLRQVKGGGVHVAIELKGQ